MATPAQELISKRSGFPRLEALTRVSAVAIGSIYVAGFIIVTIYHAEFGIGEIGLFKARVLSAGILFALLTALPVALAGRIYGYFGLGPAMTIMPTEPGKEWLGELHAGIRLYLPCLALVFVTLTLFQDDPPATSHWGVGAIIVSYSLIYCLRFLPTKYLGATLLVLIAAIVGLGWGTYHFQGQAFFLRSLWFYLCAVATKGMHGFVHDPAKLRTLEWETWVGALVIVLSFFSVSVYGHAKFRYGGGAAVPVRLYLSSDAPKLFPSDAVQTGLLEETDAGFYIVRDSKDPSSLFIPRSEVRALEFNVPDSAKTDSSKSPTKPSVPDRQWLHSF